MEPQNLFGRLASIFCFMTVALYEVRTICKVRKTNYFLFHSQLKWTIIKSHQIEPSKLFGCLASIFSVMAVAFCGFWVAVAFSAFFSFLFASKQIEVFLFHFKNPSFFALYFWMCSSYYTPKWILNSSGTRMFFHSCVNIHVCGIYWFFYVLG